MPRVRQPARSRAFCYRHDVATIYVIDYAYCHFEVIYAKVYGFFREYAAVAITP